MFRIVDARQAVEHIRDGDCIGINAFLALCNPEALHRALFDRVRETGHPRDLRLFCAAGFGGWDESRFADPYIAAGAVREIVAGHFSSMPAAVRLARENKIEAYNLPLGVLSHAIRAAAAGQEGLLSELGLNLFVDPRVGGPGMNAISTKKTGLERRDGRQGIPLLQNPEARHRLHPRHHARSQRQHQF